MTAAVGVHQAMVPSGSPEYADAVWIGVIDDVEFTAGRQYLVGVEGYRSVRLLVRSGRHPRGFIEMPARSGQYDLPKALAAIAALPAAQVQPPAPRPPISIVLCTFDRPDMLTDALHTLLRLDYPDFEVVVVDNHPASGLTGPVVRSVADSRIRFVEEGHAGLSRARNRGAMTARHRLVAFTDDDVAVDSYWLQGIADGFAAGSDVACVSGMVPTGVILSPAQGYFDRRVSWAKNTSREVFSLATPRPTEPLFPFQVARYGTGANFAVDRNILVEIGGFDEGLGVGSKCGGGEDIDLFVRVLLAGHQLAYEPSALVWHRHRIDFESLRRQIIDYGTGLGAWLTKSALHPRTLLMMMRRAVAGVRHLGRVTQIDEPVPGLPPEQLALWKVERRAVLLGPVALARSRFAGARKRPLAGSGRSALGVESRIHALEES